VKSFAHSHYDVLPQAKNYGAKLSWTEAFKSTSLINLFSFSLTITGIFHSNKQTNTNNVLCHGPWLQIISLSLPSSLTLKKLFISFCFICTMWRILVTDFMRQFRGSNGITLSK
jgi:hypothetical protein